MSKYAKIENSIVVNIIVCEDADISSQNGHHVKVTDGTNNPVIGFEYNSEKNKFTSPQPFESWVLNVDTLLWEAPLAKPDQEGYYRWDEDTQEWVQVS